nr:FixH family protein [Devosia oryzisoli]
MVAGGIAFAATRSTPPADLDYSLSHLSKDGHYQVTLVPGIDPVPVGKMHAWLVDVTDAAGQPVDADIVIDGGMPQHGHGLPTVPAVTGKDHHGRHIVGGMRFNMPGWWVLKVEISGTAGVDTATFNLAL